MSMPPGRPNPDITATRAVAAYSTADNDSTMKPIASSHHGRQSSLTHQYQLERR
jgi:hypothetical protein